MITFPSWVEKPAEHRDDGDDMEHIRACKRLRYMIYLAAINATEAASISALADKCGIERAQLHAAIREGKFSAQMAAKVERACGRKVIQRDWLMFPLELEELAL